MAALVTDQSLTIDDLVFDTTEVDVDGHILTVTLNRPERKNAINAAMAAEIIYALDYAKQERSIRVVVFKARGNIFCAGGDLSSMAGNQTETSSTVPVRGGADDIALRIRHLNKPTIAQIQGSVYAGGLLFLCNVTHAIAVDTAIFAAPEIKRGIWPFMVMAGLFRVMPKRPALDFIMRGEPIGASDAWRLGLLNRVVSSEELSGVVAGLANDLASLAPSTMELGLAAFNEQESMEFDSALPYLRAKLDQCLDSPDAKEGISAFMEKRKPIWD